MTMASTARQPAAETAAENARKYDDVAPVLGFREYWYPVCLSKEVTEKPLAMKLMNEPIMFVRRSGKVYAVADECPHRGVRLSLGSCEFPGTNTISCIYHGWTFDVTNGRCVAALTDGPSSPIVNKARVRTYPITECQGLVWIWMGKQTPVAPEEDIPEVIRKATHIKVFRRKAYGNWRWHIENGAIGHALMLHRTAWYIKVKKPFPGAVDGTEGRLEEGDSGPWVVEHPGRPYFTTEYPGLGKWPRPSWKWMFKFFNEGMSPLMGVAGKVSMRLPAVARITHFPIRGAMLYEFPMQIDADHYNYFQIICGEPKNLFARAWFNLRYYLWGKPFGLEQFNGQDMLVVADSEDSSKRHGGRWFPPSSLYKADDYYFAWRDYVVRNARDLKN